MSEPDRTGEDLTLELLQALLAASDVKRQAALRLLRGETDEGAESGQAEPYLTLREIGRQLNISPCSLWRWDVPGHELGGRRRFRMSEVEAYLESDVFRRRVDELRRERGASAGEDKRQGRRKR